MRWEDLPSKIDLKQDLFLVIEGPVTMSESFIDIHPSSDRDMGWIESEINISPTSLIDSSELYYSLEQQDDETRLKLHLPPWDWKHDGDYVRPCVQVRMNIYLPDKVKSLRTSVNNIPIHVTDGSHVAKWEDVELDNVVTLETDRVELTTANAAILVDAAWEGDTMTLTTSNGEIRLMGPMEAGDWIRLQSSNGALTTAGTLTSKGRIDMTTSNGKVLAQSLIAKDTLQITTSNAAINLQSKTSANQIILQSSNGPLQLPFLVAESSLTATTSNALIDAQVTGEKDPQLRFTTGNSRVNLKLVSGVKLYQGVLLTCFYD